MNEPEIDEKIIVPDAPRELGIGPGSRDPARGAMPIAAEPELILGGPDSRALIAAAGIATAGEIEP